MKSNYLKKPFIIVPALLVLLFLAGLIGTPYLIDMGLERWLASQGPEIGQVENIDFNPFSGRLAMDNLVVETKTGRTLNVSHAELTFSWKQLFKKQLYLKELVLQDTFLVIDRLEGTGFRVGGLILRELIGAKGKSDTPGWDVGIGRFVLQNARFDYDTPELTATYVVDRYTLTGLETWNKKKPVEMELVGRVNESPVHIRAEVKPLDEVKTWKGSIIFENGSLELISKVRGLQEYAPSGTINIDMQLDAQMQKDGAIIFDADGAVGLDKLQIQHEGYGLQQENIAWQGRISGKKTAGQVLAINFDGKLAGSGMALENSGKSLQQQLVAFNWDGKAGFSQQVEAKNSIFDAEGDVTLNILQIQHEGYGLQQENIAWQGSIAGSIAAGQQLALEVDGQLTGKNLSLDSRVNSLQLLLGAFNWQGKAGLSQMEDSLGVTMESELNGDDALVNDEQNNVRLLGLEKFSIAGIEIAGLDDIRVSRVDLQNMRLVEKKKSAVQEAKKGVAPLLQTASVAISTTRLAAGNDLSIGDIKLQDLEAFVLRDKEGKWQLVPSLPGGRQEAALQQAVKEDAEIVAREAGPIKIRLDNLEVGGKSSVRFEDESLRQPFRTIFHIRELQVADINTAEALTPARFILKGQVSDYGTVAFDGAVKPAENPLTLDLKGKIGALDMPPFTSYTGRTIGYNVTSGQMDADIIMKIDKGKLDGDFALRMRNLKMVRLATDKVPEIDNQLDVPLETALSMLRDKKDEIKIDLKLQGDITKPEFGIQDAINQALATAMKFAAVNYLKYTLQPFGTYIALAEVVGKAGKEMAKVRLDPITFPAAEIVLDETAIQYLTKVKEVLTNRPKLRIELCGKAVVKDRVVLLERLQAAKKKEEEKGGKAGTSAEEIAVSDEILLDFAKQRAELVKESLVKEHGIAHERIYLCLPDIDETPEKSPYVELLLD